jgi:hypothetical protein
LGHFFLLVWEEHAPSVLDYPASSLANKTIPSSELIGMTGISDRHGPELVIGMRRNQ